MHTFAIDHRVLWARSLGILPALWECTLRGPMVKELKKVTSEITEDGSKMPNYAWFPKHCRQHLRRWLAKQDTPCHYVS